MTTLATPAIVADPLASLRTWEPVLAVPSYDTPHGRKSCDGVGQVVYRSNTGKALFMPGPRYQLVPNADKAEKGFIARIFSGSDKGAPPVKYRITLKSQGESTTVSVLNAAGAPETSVDAQRIVKVIADDLK